ncbi:hypothetical protein [Peribacillus frigoritolerans]|uniref:Uncharacterized protein n=1 Tax=Peribacillus frigoritolerans TaxID=450367 RepID=A0AAJ1QKL9_9BACI|nr:hypothetical protein [Peribacillus frigoritolerans]MDM5283118.1 hypothetical protein [Peribacillus frigoritolerans]
MEIKKIESDRFKAVYVGEKTMEIQQMRVWRSKDGSIHFKINGKPTSVNNNPESKRGNPNLWNALDAVLNELGITQGVEEEE